MYTQELFRQYLALNPILPAPMCNYTDRPYRNILRAFGAGLVYTEMFSSEAIARGDTKSWKMMDYVGEEAPVAVQLFGSRPAILAEAARIAVRMGANVIDLNMGCPARKVFGANCGSALLKDPENVLQIVRAVRAAVDVPVTAKMRWHPPDGANTLQVARYCQGEGLDAVALHGRTRAQGYSGTANWDWIKRLRDIMSISVIGNGDVLSLDDARRMMRETGCDAVMVGRAIIGNPWLVGHGRILTKAYAHSEAVEPTLEERLGMMIQHAGAMHALRGDPAIMGFRKHCVGYIRGLAGGRAFRNELMRFVTLREFTEAVQEYIEKVKSGMIFDVESAEPPEEYAME